MAVIVNGKPVVYVQGSSTTWVSGFTTSSTSGDIAILKGTGGQVIADSGILAASILTSGSVTGGASLWTALTANTDFVTTGASTSTIIMNTDQTANIKVGYSLKMVFNGTTLYEVVAAITSSLLTFAGPPITTGAGLLTALSWGDTS